MKNDDKPIANPFVVLREEFDDWAVLFDADTGHCFGLNPTGVYFWKVLNGGHTLDALLQKVRHDTDTVSEVASISGHSPMSSLQRGSPGSTARRLNRKCVQLLTMGP